jgi:hypothetical protein
LKGGVVKDGNLVGLAAGCQFLNLYPPKIPFKFRLTAAVGQREVRCRVKTRGRIGFSVHAVKHGRAEFTWGAGKDSVAEGHARIRYLAALRAIDAGENEVKPLLDFARS